MRVAPGSGLDSTGRRRVAPDSGARTRVAPSGASNWVGAKGETVVAGLPAPRTVPHARQNRSSFLTVRPHSGQDRVSSCSAVMLSPPDAACSPSYDEHVHRRHDEKLTRHTHLG